MQLADIHIPNSSLTRKSIDLEKETEHIKIPDSCVKAIGYFLVRPARTYSNGCKSLKRPDNGKYIANGKGVHREVESEGSLRQISGLTYRNLILRLKDVDKFAKQNEVL